MENEKVNSVENEVVVGLNEGNEPEVSSRRTGDSHLESDLTESVDETFDEDQKQVDYSTFTKKDFVELVKELSKENNFRHIDEVLKEAKPLFDEIRQKERSE